MTSKCSPCPTAIFRSLHINLPFNETHRIAALTLQPAPNKGHILHPPPAFTAESHTVCISKNPRQSCPGPQCIVLLYFLIYSLIYDLFYYFKVKPLHFYCLFTYILSYDSSLVNVRNLNKLLESHWVSCWKMWEVYQSSKPTG